MTDPRVRNANNKRTIITVLAVHECAAYALHLARLVGVLNKVRNERLQLRHFGVSR